VIATDYLLEICGQTTFAIRRAKAGLPVGESGSQGPRDAWRDVVPNVEPCRQVVAGSRFAPQGLGTHMVASSDKQNKLCLGWRLFPEGGTAK
jgi:hypothetical protein